MPSSRVQSWRCAPPSESKISLWDRNAGAAAGQRLELRTAVHQGDVIVENGDLLGDGVNVAARLEALAEPGGICISARVYEDATGKIELDAEDMGEQELKNIARPVRVYRLKPDRTNLPSPNSRRPAIFPALPSLLPLPRAGSIAAAPGLVYADFAAAIKTALRDFHRPDLLARNPLLSQGIGNLGVSTGSAAPELQAWLSEAARAVFSNPRDEKLRRVINLTHFQPASQQEAVAERLSLSFGAYRRHLTTARNRLARWLWESLPAASIRSELPSAGRVAAAGENRKDETSPPPDAGPFARRLSLVVPPFISIGGDAEHDHFAEGITETLTTDLSRISDLFELSLDRPPMFGLALGAICERYTTVTTLCVNRVLINLHARLDF